MITLANIKELLNRRPIRPITVLLSDGSHHDVPHPELAQIELGGSEAFPTIA